MRLFLYGTLLAETDTPMARWLAPKLSHPRRAWVHGRLFAVPSRQGWYPALVPGRGRVWGVVVEARLSSADVGRLDRYEGREYRRKRVGVRAGGQVHRAQLYVWVGHVPDGVIAMSAGSFMVWLSHAGGDLFRP